MHPLTHQLPHEIVVPGSISNLGAGFDTLSVAVELYLRVRIVEILPGAPGTIATTFTGAAPAGENRIETAFLAAGREAARPVPGVRLEVETDIPVRAGLGSSGAATVAGMRIYEALTAPRPGEEWLPLARDNRRPSRQRGRGAVRRRDAQLPARRWRDHRARVELAGRAACSSS